jgi:hypothetical protein
VYLGYPRGVAGKPAEPSPSTAAARSGQGCGYEEVGSGRGEAAGRGGEAAGGRGQAGRGEPDCGQQRELVGPLVLARHVKDDGRALLLYTRAAREPT